MGTVRVSNRPGARWVWVVTMILAFLALGRRR